MNGYYRSIMDLNRVQGSMYNQTFDEVECQLGNNNTRNSHNHMNFDMQNPSFSSFQQGNISNNNTNGGFNGTTLSNSTTNGGFNGTTLSSSSFHLGNNTINNTTNRGFNGTTLSSSSSSNNNINNNNNRSIDEVWMEINNNQNNVTTTHNLQQSTMQGFLAGGGSGGTVINNHAIGGDVAAPLVPPSPTPLLPMVMNSQPQGEWFQLQMATPMQIVCPNFHQQQQQQQEQDDFRSHLRNQVLDIDFSSVPVSIEMSMFETPVSSTDSKGGHCVGSSSSSRNRYSDEMLEQAIERRQRRMAKNRASAARSRAKKQERICKLKLKRDQLQNNAMMLKKEMEVEDRFFPTTPLTQRYQLRRTSSCTF